jgi:pyridoxine kinase
MVFPPEHIENLFEGLARRGVLEKIDAVLTGYLGDPAIGELILARMPEGVLWLCDPVMGDVGRGFFVRDGIPDFFKRRAVSKAAIMTPNQFELEYLSGYSIKTLEDARNACRELHEAGVETLLVTSLIHEDTPHSEIHILASSRSGAQYLVKTPRVAVEPAPNGAGDCTAALFLGHLLRGAKIEEALGATAGSMLALFEKTREAGTRELALIAAQEYFASPHPQPVEQLTD